MANQHVVPNDGKWQLKRENAVRATKTFDKIGRASCRERV